MRPTIKLWQGWTGKWNWQLGGRDFVSRAVVMGLADSKEEATQQAKTAQKEYTRPLVTHVERR